MPRNEEKVKLKLWEEFCLGCCAGAASKLLSHPLDNIRLRRQLIRYPYTASNGKIYSGTTLGVAQQLIDEGFLSVFGGAIPNCFRFFPTQMVNIIFKGPINDYFKVKNKNSSFLKKLLSKVLPGTLVGLISLGAVHGMDRWRLVAALPPECVTEPSTYYQMYSGFGVSLVGMSGNVLYNILQPPPSL